MLTVQLPYEVLYLCEICGYTDSEKNEIVGHEQIPKISIADVGVGQEVLLYERKWFADGQMSITDQPSPWTVTDLSYSPNEIRHIQGRMPIEIHELQIGLVQCFEFKPQGTQVHAFKPGHHCPQHLITLSWKEFCLWRSQDIEELTRQGLIEPPKQKMWDKARDYIGQKS